VALYLQLFESLTTSLKTWLSDLVTSKVDSAVSTATPSLISNLENYIDEQIRIKLGTLPICPPKPTCPPCPPPPCPGDSNCGDLSDIIFNTSPIQTNPEDFLVNEQLPAPEYLGGRGKGGCGSYEGPDKLPPWIITLEPEYGTITSHIAEYSIVGEELVMLNFDVLITDLQASYYKIPINAPVLTKAGGRYEGTVMYEQHALENGTTEERDAFYAPGKISIIDKIIYFWGFPFEIKTSYRIRGQVFYRAR
jgi:hypothetical protein